MNTTPDTPRPSVSDAGIDIPSEALAEHVRGWLSTRYDVPIVRIGEDGRVEVPAGKALAFARQQAFSAGVDPALIHELDTGTLVWLAVPREGIILWRSHGRRDEQVTALEPGDPAVQVVHGHEGWELVRTLDGAQGWMPAVEWEPGERPAVAPAHELDPRAFVECASGFVDVPYMWGGTTSEGVDCSGLVQRSAWMASRVWLPRHSTAMLKVGRRVALDGHEGGDIVVLRRRPEHREPGMRGTSHVGIALDQGRFLHASPHAGKVIEESLDAVLERYQPLGVRRLAQAKG